MNCLSVSSLSVPLTRQEMFGMLLGEELHRQPSTTMGMRGYHLAVTPTLFNWFFVE